MTVILTVSNKTAKNINNNTYGDVLPDTWTATDGLGRTLPQYEETGERKEDKFVGMFYWIWHYNFAKDYPARNVSEILKLNPQAVNDYSSPVWENTTEGTPYYWNEPLFGYYSDLDRYVLRKHAEMIADAGVDVIIFDCTNGTETWDEAYEVLFEVFTQAKKDGVNVPQIAFMLPFNDGEDTRTSLRNLYDRIYSKNRYSELWFMWDEKPLIMAHATALDKSDATDAEIADFFTFRKNEPAYFVGDTKMSKKTWGWCSVYPQTKFGTEFLSGDTEEMCVSVAQNASNTELAAMNSPDVTVHGRSYTHGDYSYSFIKDGKEVTVDRNTPDAILYGLNFQQQWDNAIETDPDFIFITGWNEWIAGRFSEWQGTQNAFPDQCSDEYSRDIEPSNGILKDYYYYQLVSNIRRFKGMSAPQSSAVPHTVDIYGGDGQWKDTDSVYYHYTGNTGKRDADGWQGLHYTADTMRNDFEKISVTYDDSYLYFRIQTVDNISPYTDNAWMRLLLDTSSDGTETSWECFEYIINRSGADEFSLTVEKSTGGWNFTQTGKADYTVQDNVMVMRVPREAVGLTDNAEFNFKFSDNMQTDGDIMDFYKSGDTAPGGRFTFCFR